METARQTVGIVGGLCPLATADIYLKAMRLVRAERGDSDYPDIIINAAVEETHRGNEFDQARNYDMAHRVLYIYQAARELKRQKVDRILVPDFLSYTSANAISTNIEVPLVDIVDVLVREVKARCPQATTVGLLTTDSSIRQKIFEQPFSKSGLRVVYPDDKAQDTLVMEAIYGVQGVKRGVTTGKPGELIREACAHLYARGADVISTAVTELPLIERHYYPQERYVDCNEAIGAALVSTDNAPRATERRRKVVGVLGGLGPAATVDLFDKIVKHTPAQRDQDHIKIIIENNPQVPDRTAALKGEGEDPSVALLAGAEKLKSAGADFIIVPCNTAHAFLRKVQQHIQLPILSMVDKTGEYIAAKYPAVKRVGLLATTGTVESRVYEEPLTQRGLTLVTPSHDTQEKMVMGPIYGPSGIKAGVRTGLPREQLLTAAKELLAAGAQLVILGCTEIPLALKDGDLPVPFVDPTEVLALAAIEQATANSSGGSRPTH